MRYKIKFFTYWHCSSGLSGGSSADALVIRDSKGLPFVPGKTIKGHIKEACEILYGSKSDFVKRCFGLENRVIGKAHFTDAYFPYKIDKSKVSYLFDRLTFTAIDKESGVADDDTLRSIEVVVPLELEGEIIGLSQEDEEMIIPALSMVKRIGLMRHRGLGRCDIFIEGKTK